MAPTSSETIDRSAMFLTYLAFMGDIHRTAAALMVEPAKVKAAAEFEQWDKKVAHLKSVKSGMGPDEFLRELNRVVNFVQALRLRSVMDKLILKVSGDEATFDDFVTKQTKDCTNRDPAALLGVIRCVEAVHRMTYAALGDIPGKTDLERGDKDKGATALSILSALSSQVSSSEPSALAAGVVPSPDNTQSTMPEQVTAKPEEGV